MLSQTITFLIALAVVWKFGWKPVLQIVHDRQEKVRKTMEDAENTRLAIQGLETEYRAKLEQVEQKSSELIALARQDAGRVKEELMAAAQAEAMELQKKAHEQVEHERRQIMSEMRAEIVSLSLAVAEKMLSKPIPGDVHDRKFQEMLDEVSKSRVQEA
jgi:F-type H+-transporting ATPase subunit b